MPEIKSHASLAADTRARLAPTPTIDQKIEAMEGALSKLVHRVDGAVARADAKRDDDNAKRRDDDLDQRIADAVARAMRKYDAKRRRDGGYDDEQEEGEDGQPRAMSGDDNRETDEGEPHHTPGEGSEFREHGGTEDRHHDRRDTRADALADSHRLAEFQHRADRVAQMHGRSIEKPRLGDSYKSYLPRTLNQLAYHCLPKGHQLHRADFRLNADPRQLEDLKERVLMDGEAAAYNASHNTAGGMQREVVRYDASGRKIVEFVGPVSAPNGALAPFKAPTLSLNLRALQDKCDRIEASWAMGEAMRGRK